MSTDSIPPAVTNRRRFIGAAVATAASYGRILGANDRIRIAGIGTGGRGEYLLGNVAKLEGTEIVGFCDVYEPHRLRAKARYAATAPDYVDHGKVLDRKDVDAVVIATPDHWHVPITIDAVARRKGRVLREARDAYAGRRRAADRRRQRKQARGPDRHAAAQLGALHAREGADRGRHARAR